MPGTRADRIVLRTLTQQRQEQQRAQVSQKAQGVTVQFQPHANEPGSWLGGQPLSPTYTPPVKPDVSVPEVGRRIEQELAHLPQVSQSLTPAQEAALDLLDALAGELARYLSPQVLIDRLPALGAAAGQAVRNAIAEAGR